MNAFVSIPTDLPSYHDPIPWGMIIREPEPLLPVGVDFITMEVDQWWIAPLWILSNDNPNAFRVDPKTWTTYAQNHPNGMWIREGLRFTVVDHTFQDAQHGPSPEWRKVVNLWRDAKSNGYTILAHTLAGPRSWSGPMIGLGILASICLLICAWELIQIWRITRKKGGNE